MYQCYLSAYNKPYLEENCKEFSIITTTIAAVLQMIVEKDTVMIKAAHVGQLLFHKKEKVWQRERIIFDSMIHSVL